MSAEHDRLVLENLRELFKRLYELGEMFGELLERVKKLESVHCR